LVASASPYLLQERFLITVKAGRSPALRPKSRLRDPIGGGPLPIRTNDLSGDGSCASTKLPPKVVAVPLVGASRASA